LKTLEHIKIFAKFKSRNGRIPICGSQSALHSQEIYTPQWLNLSAMMNVMYNIAFSATNMDFKILSFLQSKLLEMSSNGKIT